MGLTDKILPAYMMERHFAAINNFAMFLDDEDVCQMLPVRADHFEQGVSGTEKLSVKYVLLIFA